MLPLANSKLTEILMNNGLVLAIVTAIGFGSWPIVGRIVGANQFWMVTLVMLPTIIITSFAYSNEIATVPEIGAMIALIVSGVMNGISMLTATKIILDRALEISSLFPIINIATITMSALCGIVFLHECVTASKAVGLACACAAAWLLSR